MAYVKGFRGNEEFYFDGCYNPYPINGNERHKPRFPIGHAYGDDYAKETADYLNTQNDFTHIKWQAVSDDIMTQDKLIFCKNFILENE